MTNFDAAPPCAICSNHRDANVHLAQYRYSGYHEYSAQLPIIDAPAIAQEQFPPPKEFPSMSTPETVDLSDEPTRASSPKPSECKYPEVVVALVGGDGNACAVLGAVQKALRRAGVAREEISQYIAEATNGDYDHLLATTMRWVTAK